MQEVDDKILIRLYKVTAGYGDKIILRDVDFKVCKGDFIGVIGPNGGGKTTLIKTILGIIPSLSGSIDYSSGIRMGYLPQITTIIKDFPISARDVVCSGLSSGNFSGGLMSKPDYGRAEELLEWLSVGYLAKYQIGRLSGGELQRVLLARAIMCNPHVLILDEPTTYVDNKFENKMYEILHQLNEKVAIVMVSHDLGMISRHVKGIACVNRSLHYHNSNIITAHQLDMYDCPMQLLEHGKVPHTVLEMHN